MLHQVLQQSIVGTALVDLQGRYVEVKDLFCEALGETREGLLSLTLDVHVSPRARGAGDRVDGPSAAGIPSGQTRAESKVSVRRGDGQVVWATMVASLLTDSDGKPALVMVQFRDLDPRVALAEQAALQSDRQAAVARLVQRALGGLNLESLFREALEAVVQGLEVEIADILEVQPGAGKCRLRAEVGWKAGHPEDLPAGPGSEVSFVLATPDVVTVENLSTEERFAPAEVLLEQRIVSSMSLAIASEGKPWAVLSARTKSRRRFTEDDARFLRVVANIVGAAMDRERREEQMRHQATHDELTGLANRSLLLDRLGLALLRMRRGRDPLAFIFADLDHFKELNDHYGHAAGDAVLKEVSKRLQKAVRAEDTVARFGGDEFVVLCESVSGPKEAAAIAQRVATTLKAPLSTDGLAGSAVASIGVAVTDDPEIQPDALIDEADAAMYKAKARGGGGWHLSEAMMHGPGQPKGPRR
jgi:diguanylate cyclase (GGDEF)-like protein/PAS domain S-box-containing protein